MKSPRPVKNGSPKKARSPAALHEEKIPGRKRRFSVPIYVEIEVEDNLLTSVLTTEWREQYYYLISAREVAGHLAYNLIQGRGLPSLDGFANQPERATRILDIYLDHEDTQELPRHEIAEGGFSTRLGPKDRLYAWKCTCGARGETWHTSFKKAMRSYQQHLTTEARAASAEERAS